MSHLQKQSLPNGRAVLHLAQAVYRPGQTPAQSRIYLGVLKDETLVVGKKFTKRSGHVIPLATIREQHQAGRLLEWLEVAPEETPIIAKPKLGRPRKSPIAAAATPSPAKPAQSAASEEESRLAAKTRMANAAAVDEVGSWHVLETIAQESGLLPVLRKAFGDNEGWRLFAIACHQVITGAPLYLIEDWAVDQPLPLELIDADFSSPALSAFMEKLGRDCATVEAFHRYWIDNLGRPKSLIYDLTSISSYSAHPLVEFGYNRDKEPLPQINLALVVDAVTSLPVLLRALPGSIADVKTLKLTCDLLAGYGLEDFSARLDRGFDSEKNLRDLLDANLNFTLAAKIDGSRAQKLIASHGDSLLLPGSSTFFDGERLLRHASDSFPVKGTQGPDGKPKKVKLHLYCDPEQRAIMIRSLERRCVTLAKDAEGQIFASKDEAQAWLDKQENAQSRKAFAADPIPKAKSDKSPDQWRINLDSRALQASCRNFGFFAIYSSDLESSREAVIEDYRLRDIAEKDLDVLKNENGHDRLRTGNPFVAQGRLVLAFISLILHLALQKRMKAADLIKSYSVAELLGMLRRIRVIRTAEGLIYTTEIPKKCVKALEAMGIPLPN